jgi:hypothetical protein
VYPVDILTCVPLSVDFLLFSQKNVISRLVIDNDDLDPDIPEVVLPIPQLRNIKGLAYDPVDNYIYQKCLIHAILFFST